MVLKLESKYDINKFYFMLPLYKSLIFKFIKFEVNTDDDNLKKIIEGLNIKNRRKRIEFVYDEACKMIDDFYRGENICGFKCGKCYSQRCMKKDYYNGCCRKCLYQSDHGCPTKNLACKLFVCSEVTKRYEVIKYRDLKILKLFSIKNRFIVKSDYFSLREDVLKDLYTYTLTYAFLRTIYRIIKNYIIFERN